MTLTHAIDSANQPSSTIPAPPRPRNGKKIGWTIAGVIAALGMLGQAIERAERPAPVANRVDGGVTSIADYDDPRGFSIGQPDGWQVIAPSPVEITVTDPQYLSAAMIRARPVQGDLAQWLARDFARGERWIRQSETITVDMSDATTARAQLRVVDSNGVRKLVNLIAVAHGGLATVFAAAAPEDRFAAQLPQLASILQRFHLRAVQPQSPTAQAPTLAFQPWQDPHEHAFTVDIAQGWTPDGGMLRSNGRPALGLSASAGNDPSTQIFVGDRPRPAFIFPTAIAASFGQTEGGTYSSDGGMTHYTILSFPDVGQLGERMLAERFGNVQITARRERTDLIEARRRTEPVPPGVHHHVGAVDLDFRSGDGRVGTITVSASGQQSAELGGTWQINGVSGFIARPQTSGLAALALGRALVSLHIDPNWWVREMHASAADFEAWRRSNAQINEMNRQTTEARWASDVQRQGAIGDILRGTVNAVDPASGREYQVQNSNNYYYLPVSATGDGPIVGTNIDENPAPQLDMHRLLQIGVDMPYR
ncbi:MAG: hypothetical protein ABI451_03450 [Dokdonella sp.]